MLSKTFQGPGAALPGLRDKDESDVTSPQAVPLRILLLASLGGALEFYDFVVFVFFASFIQALFFSAGSSEFLRLAQTFGIFAAGYLTRPVGGIIMAHFGDTHGRKRVFTFSILLMALPTLAIGMLPTYAKIGVAAPLLLLLMRMIQGAAIGVEAPGGWVYVSEHAPQRMRGLAIGMLTSGLTLGILLGSLVSFLLNTSFNKAAMLAGMWRVPFLLGGVFGLAGMWLRKQLAETPVFLQMKRRSAQFPSLPLKDLLRDHRPAVLSSIVVTWMLTAAIVVVILMTPSLLNQLYHLPAHSLQIASLAAAAALCIGAVFFGHATDRFGLRATAVASVALLIASTYLLFAFAGTAGPWLTPLYALAGLGAGAASLTPICIVRLFPAPVRFTGVSFSYNLSYAILGGITPPLVIWLLHFGRLAPAHYVAIASICVLMVILGQKSFVRGAESDATLSASQDEKAASLRSR